MTRVVLGALLLPIGHMTVASASPAVDAELAIATLRDQDARILAIGERLARAGTPFCPTRGHPPGMLIQTLGQYGPDYRPAAAALLRLADRPTVAVVDPDGAAARAGIRPGDQLVTADSHAFLPDASGSARGSYTATAAAVALLDEALADGRATLRLARDGRDHTVTLSPAAGCRARFEVRPGRAQGATADGAIVQISSGLIAVARSDAEIAAVLAHELAHNVLRHPQRLRARERGLKVRDSETAADRLSVYLLDAAGYAPADAAGFWRSWGRARDRGIFADNSHPGWRTRAATIEAEAAVIAGQRAAGQPVTPPPELRP